MLHMAIDMRFAQKDFAIEIYLPFPQNVCPSWLRAHSLWGQFPFMAVAKKA